MACEFLWSGKRCKIAYNTLVQSIQDGGLKLMDLDTRVTISLLSWARRIIANPEGSAGNLVRIFCGESNPALIWASKRNFSNRLSAISPFYFEVLRTWHQFHNFNPVGEEDIREEIIWNNPRIPSLAEGRSRHRWDKWISAGIMTVGHLCHPTQGRLLGQQEVEDIFCIQPTFLEALAMRNYIPILWKRALTDSVQNKENISYKIRINGLTFDINDSSPKEWYRAAIQGKKQEIKRQKSWNTELASIGENTPTQWEATYSLPYKITRETKLQSFQFRILHRLITCKKYLHSINMHENGSCPFCGEKDSISHFFLTCSKVTGFWENLGGWCQSHLNLQLSSLTKTEKLLGLLNVNGNTRTFKVINWILLTAKYYIHRQRLFHEGEVSLIAFLSEAKNKLSTEKLICTQEGNPNKFKIWEKMLKILSP